MAGRRCAPVVYVLTLNSGPGWARSPRGVPQRTASANSGTTARVGMGNGTRMTAFLGSLDRTMRSRARSFPPRNSFRNEWVACLCAAFASTESQEPRRDPGRAGGKGAVGLRGEAGALLHCEVL